MQLRQHHRIASVGLDPIARLHRNERGRDNHTVMAEFGQLPVQTVAAGTSLVAELQAAPVGAELPGQLPDMVGAVRNRAPVAHITATLSLRNRN